jgi:hypothetical protein
MDCPTVKKIRMIGKIISYYMCCECVEKNKNRDRLFTDLGK